MPLPTKHAVDVTTYPALPTEHQMRYASLELAVTGKYDDPIGTAEKFLSFLKGEDE